MKRFLSTLIVLAVLLGAFGSVASAQELEPLEDPIVWYVRGSVADVQDGVDAVNDAVNAYLAEQSFNAEVEIVFLDRSEFDDRMSLINAAFEPYDLALTTYSWVNQYPANVENEYFIPLTAYENPDTGETVNLLETYAPELFASMPAEAWDAARIDGEVYAFINQQIWPKPFGVSLRTDVIEGLGLQEAWDAMETWEDLTPLMEAINTAIEDGSIVDAVEDGENVQYVFANEGLLRPENFGYDPVAPYVVIDALSDDLTAVSFFETEAYLNAAQIRRDWQVAGFTLPDAVDNETMNNGYAAGQWVLDAGRLIKPGGALEQAARYGYSWTEKSLSPTVLTTAGPVSSMTGISTTNEDNPQRVARIVMFMEMVHTDPVLYNLIAKGIEGTNWEWANQDDSLITLISDSGYNPNVDWALGNQFNAYYIDEAQIGAWEESLDMNTNSIPSPALGFVFDRSSVDLDIVALDGVMPEFVAPIFNGQAEDVDAAVDQIIAVANDNGLQNVVAEVQAQLDAWSE